MMNEQNTLGVLYGGNVCGSLLRAVNVWSANSRPNHNIDLLMARCLLILPVTKQMGFAIQLAYLAIVAGSMHDWCVELVSNYCT